MRPSLCAGLLVAAGLFAPLPPALAAPALPSPAASPAPVLLPANAVVELEMVDAVSSETSHPGDFFHMRVLRPVRLGDVELVPAGAIAVGQVVHAQKAKGGGKGGELILAARYLELPQGQVKLHSTLGAAVGGNHVHAAIALAIAIGPIAMVVKGKTVTLPAGAPLSARVAVDTPITAAPVVGAATPVTNEARISTQ